MAFIIMSIFSFIICMSWAMRIALISNFDGRLVSSDLSRLLVMLLSSWSSLSYRFSSGDDYRSAHHCPIRCVDLWDVARSSGLAVAPTPSYVGYAIRQLLPGFALVFPRRWIDSCLLIDGSHRSCLDHATLCLSSDDMTNHSTYPHRWCQLMMHENHQ